MSKKKIDTKKDSAAPAAAEPEKNQWEKYVKDGRPDALELALKTRFSFPTQSRCPRCMGLQTRATSTQGNVQYRRCLAPICRHKYAVRGTPI